jgi:GT2 family glycosyltransferase
VSCGRGVGVLVVDCGAPAEGARAVESVRRSAAAATVLVVANGVELPMAAGAEANVLTLPVNQGYGAAVNRGVASLHELGCDRLLLLNSDATVEPGCIERLAEGLDDATVAAVGPTIVRLGMHTIESRGVRFDPRWGRLRLIEAGRPFRPATGCVDVDSLSGAAWMVSIEAWRRVGPLDEDYFFSFEETDWCIRARQAGFRLLVVREAVAVHAGSLTIGRGSPDRLYYAVRNHLRAVERLSPRGPVAGALRVGFVVALSLFHALRQGEVPRVAGLRAILAGVRDYQRRRFGRRVER